MDDLKKLMAEAANDLNQPLQLRLFKPEPDEGRGWLEYKDWDLWRPLWDTDPDEPGTISFTSAALIVAAVNALPELIALREENARMQERLDRIAEIAGSEKDATVALVSIGCIAQWTGEEIAADYGLTRAAPPTSKHDASKYGGWTCGKCREPVAGRYATCNACGHPDRAALNQETDK